MTQTNLRLIAARMPAPSCSTVIKQPPTRKDSLPVHAQFAVPSRLPGQQGLPHRSSSVSAPSMKSNYAGQSTFRQTARRIGMLAMPLGLAFAGWGMGIALIIFYGSISCYTYARTLDAFTSHSRASQCQNTGTNNLVGSKPPILR
ncbi:hypothetical protein B0H13DRAFT_2314526 [Mycena leptocephala]|nr:hypothetical protein B0H13DRAFT_2314526 [Mycena leptocephala]